MSPICGVPELMVASINHPEVVLVWNYMLSDQLLSFSPFFSFAQCLRLNTKISQLNSDWSSFNQTNLTRVKMVTDGATFGSILINTIWS